MIFENEEFSGWGDEHYSLECAFDFDWTEDDEGKHYCPDCYYYDDNDDLVIAAKLVF